MKRTSIGILLLFVSISSLFVGLFQSCRHEPLGLEKLEPVCFESQVLPIFQTSCAMSGCHGSIDAKEGFRATDYASIMELVKPGDPKGSKVYSILTNPLNPEMMPPDRPLTKEQRTLIQVWILQGAKNTTCANGVVSEIPVEQKNCFVQSVLPLVVSSCATSGCHDAVSHKEGLVLTSYQNIKNLVKPGKPLDSKLIEVLTKSGEDRMPPSPKNALSNDQITLLKDWISAGALNSNCPDLACDTIGTISYASKVWPIIQNNCAGCHGTTSPGGGISLTNYSQVKTAIQSMRNGISIFNGSILQMASFKAMPQGGKLSSCSIRTIQLWEQQGLLNN